MFFVVPHTLLPFFLINLAKMQTIIGRLEKVNFEFVDVRRESSFNHFAPDFQFAKILFLFLFNNIFDIFLI